MQKKVQKRKDEEKILELKKSRFCAILGRRKHLHVRY